MWETSAVLSNVEANAATSFPKPTVAPRPHALIGCRPATLTWYKTTLAQRLIVDEIILSLRWTTPSPAHRPIRCIGHVLQHPDARQGCFGRLLQTPAPLEDVIDASVKTGADLSAVIGWNYDHSRELLEAGVPIPSLLHNRRVSRATCRRKNSRRVRVSHKTIGWIVWNKASTATSTSCAQPVTPLLLPARPPDLLFDAAFADTVAQLGRALNSPSLQRSRWRRSPQHSSTACA